MELWFQRFAATRLRQSHSIGYGTAMLVFTIVCVQTSSLASSVTLDDAVGLAEARNPELASLKAGLINQQLDRGYEVRSAAFAAARQRLRPILMTASVTILGLLPMLLSNGIGAETQRPLATVVVGGLVTSTALTLILLPLLYIWLEERYRERSSQAADMSER